MYANIREVDGRPPSEIVSQCFETLAPLLLEFASRHSLLIRKYYHHQPMWSFHFLHPRGGFGSIEVYATLDGSGSIKTAVATHWWIDDLEKRQRSSSSTKSVSLIAKLPEQVVPPLEDALAEILALMPADLSTSSQTMPRKRNAAGEYVFSEFELAQRLPT
jgi:hypothetical protein